MNAHIKAIADAEHAGFVSLDYASIWNPEALKTSSAFAYNMGILQHQEKHNRNTGWLIVIPSLLTGVYGTISHNEKSRFFCFVTKVTNVTQKITMVMLFSSTL